MAGGTKLTSPGFEPAGGSVSGGPVFRKTTLPNGIRIVTEKHAHARALSVGVWIVAGTRDEHERIAGVSHFVEHMVFKRTRSRTAYQIAREMEAVGGEINAFTSREYTCFYTHSLKEHLGLSLDVLSDLACRAVFSPGEFEREKQVVLQELHMAEDNLEDFVFDLYFNNLYGNAPMGWSILGTEKSIREMRRPEVVDYYHGRYSGDRIIVSVVGAVDHDQVVELVAKKLKPRRKEGADNVRRKARMRAFREVVERPSEQVHILMGFPASSFRDRLRFEGYIVSTLLGGGMTSKLYQSVRERKGLVYSIYSQLTSFTDSGLLMVYAGAEPKNTRRVVETTLKELERLRQKGVSAHDLRLFKTQVVGQVLLGSDDVENRMNSLGVNEMVFGRYRPVEKVMEEVEAVTRDSIQEYIEKYLEPERMGLLLLGAAKQKDFSGWLKDL